MNNYDDIINLNYNMFKKSKMTLQERSAQFSPFDALEGFSDEIVTKEKIKSEKKIILEDKKININNKLNVLINNDKKEAIFKYYINDGYYETKILSVKKIDDYNKLIVFTNGQKILLDNIFDIEI